MKIYAVISHTHWDREWYAPLEIFRLRLVDLIDRCLETLKKYPAYIFHLDAQTVVLEDYLEVRPDREVELRRYITEGRLIVGPWYVQNDFYLTSGEATIRNLLEGVRVAERFGRCARVGYAPDQFGNISQLPQILDGFQVDSFVFGRGYAKMTGEGRERQRVNTPSEFFWRGADDTRLLAIHMTYWYNNAQRFSDDIDRAMIQISVADRGFDGHASTPYYLLMNGVDHLEAQDNLLPILEGMNRRLPADQQVLQMELQDYIHHVRQYISDHDVALETVRGELRMGEDYELLKGCWSSRGYLKRANVLAQNMLECRLEPLYAMLEMAGAKGAFSLDHFRYLWKQLIKNHPHDSICGCSRDEVHRHMEDNFERLEDTSEELMRRGLLLAAQHMELKDFLPENYILTVLNTTEAARGGLVRVTMDFPVQEKVAGFTIADNQGNPVDFLVISHQKARLDVFSPINLPGVLDVDRFTVDLLLPETAPLSLSGFIVKPHAIHVPLAPSLESPDISQPMTLENEYIALTVTGGRVKLLDKRTGHRVDNAVRLEETADRGDAYVYVPEDGEPAIYSTDDAVVEIGEWSAWRQSVIIRHSLTVPAYYCFDRLERAAERVDCSIALTLTVTRGDPVLEIGYVLENRAADHRIRLLINTGIQSTFSLADTPFDIQINGDDTHFPRTLSRVLPNTSFAALQGDGKCVTVFTEGTHEYEHLDDRQTLAFTLVRSTGVINRNFGTHQFESGDQWRCPANQCLRTISGRVGVAVYAGNVIHAGVPLQAKVFHNPLQVCFTSCDSRKFSGGRTAVQDTRLEELLYLPDPYFQVRIPDAVSFADMSGEGILLTAMKKAENGMGIILRYVNLSDEEVNAQLRVKGQIFRTALSERGDDYLGRDQVQVTFGPKKILTFLVKTEASEENTVP